MAKFLSKLGEFLGGGVSGGASELVRAAGDAIDKFTTTDEERERAIYVKRELEYKFKELEQALRLAYIDDRKSAREMYANDSWSQKVLTIIFTVGYLGITAFMIGIVFKLITATELNNFVVAFVSSIFGSFQAIMVQVISFYFGSSQSGENQNQRISSTFQKASNKEG